VSGFVSKETNVIIFLIKEAVMKAIVDADECTGCELCTQTCPEVFDMEDDIAIVKGDSVPGEAEETCRQAAEECPVECIAIED
jgi:ferredoxin